MNIFNKKLYKTYKDHVHLEPENIRNILYDMEKKYSSKFMYIHINLDEISINIYDNIYLYSYSNLNDNSDKYALHKCYKINKYVIYYNLKQLFIRKFKNNKKLYSMFNRIILTKKSKINRYFDIFTKYNKDGIIIEKTIYLKNNTKISFDFTYRYINYFEYIIKLMPRFYYKKKYHYNYRVAILFIFV